MSEFDSNLTQEVGEFGSRAWCEACGICGAKMLQEVDLPSDLRWGFTELYLDPHPRLVSEAWPVSGYYFMVDNGLVSGGAGVPEHCLSLPGFHVKASWAFICNQSRSKYGSSGQKQRSSEETTLKRQIEEHIGSPIAVVDIMNSVWPKSIIAALSGDDPESKTTGLHNIAASLQSPSPEFSELPCTELGVPIFNKMTETQKLKFLKLCKI